VEGGSYADSRRVTVAELTQQWLDSAEHRVAARTLQTYKGHVNNHIVPRLGSLRVDKLRPSHIEAALSDLMKTSAERTANRISPHTVSHIFGTMKAALRWATRMGLVAHNPL
jgi:integrase